jgi:putative sterol carrier protein
MPVKYLSPEWVDAHNAALAESDSVRAALKGRNAAIQMVIAGGPQGEVRYWLHIADGTASAGLGEIDNAEVTIRQSYETAAKVSKGELDGLLAFMQGKFRVKGKIVKMAQLGGPMTQMQKALAVIETEY